MTEQAAIERSAEQTEAKRMFAPGPRMVAVGKGSAALAVDLAALTEESSPPSAVRTSDALARRMLAVVDATGVFAALLVVLARFGLAVAAPAALLAMPLLVVVFKVAGLYKHDELRLHHSTLDEAPLLLQLTGVFSLVVAILLPLLPGRALSAPEIVLLWATLFAAIAAGRVGARGVARRVVPVERCLILGEVCHAQRIRQRIAASRARSEVVACMVGSEFGQLAGPELMRDVVHELGVNRIIVAPIADDGEQLVVELVRMAKAVGVKVSVLPAILNAVGAAAVFDEVEGMGLLGVPRFGLARSSWVLKRALDLVLTGIALVILGPVLVMIAIAIRLESKGPILFRQIRVGRDGEHFSIFKFRSMVTDAESLKDELRSLSVAGAGLFKVQNDPRITRVGHFLRRSSLDELPQLLNVLRGEMSLVGPRPLVADEDAQVLGLDRSRLRLTPGMTGPWQLQRSRVPLAEMVEIDYLYASSWSLWLDIKIMLRTVQHVARRGNL